MTFDSTFQNGSDSLIYVQIEPERIKHIKVHICNDKCFIERGIGKKKAFQVISFSAFSKRNTLQSKPKMQVNKPVF